MKRNHLFFCLAALCLMGTLQSCNDDDEITKVPDEEVEDIPGFDPPTHDVVETEVWARASVFAVAPSDMARPFIKRLTNAAPAPVIADDTELVVLDEASAADILRDEEAFARLLEFYERRGGIIYLDQPALQQAALVARLQQRVYNPVPDEDDIIKPLYETYIFRRDGSEKITPHVYHSGEHTVAVADTLGNTKTETHTADEKPSEYLYGQFAESSARFINDLPRTRTRALPVTRGNVADPPLIPKECDIKITQKFDKRYGDDKTEVSVVATVQVYSRALYSFEHDKDYYQVKMKQIFPGHKSWLGRGDRDFAAYTDKSAGASYGGLDVELVMYNGLDYLTADWSDDTGYSLLDVLPHNESQEGSITELKGFEIGGSVGFPSGQSGGGLNVGLSGSYCQSTSVTMPVREMNCEYKPNSKRWLVWEYDISGPHFEHRPALNAKYTPPTELGTKNVETEQAFNFTIDGTKYWDEDNYAEIDVAYTFYLCHGWGSAGGGRNSSANFRTGHTVFHRPAMLVPGRHKETMTIVAEPADADLSEPLRQTLVNNSAAFRYLSENPERCGITRNQLKKLMSREWQDVCDEVKHLKLTGKGSPVTFYLKFGPDGYLPLADSAHKGIRINADGSVETAP